MISEEKWYCYVCGKLVGKEFFLWSFSKRTDRVFLCCSNIYCLEQIEHKDLFLIKVLVKDE